MTLQEHPRLFPDETPPATFHAFVRHCRADRGLSQEAFAALFDGDLNQSTIARWESGDRRLPRHDLLIRLADICAVPPGRLLDLLGFWGSRVDLDGVVGDVGTTTDLAPSLREVLEAARPLSTQQRRALAALARQMRR